RHEDLRAGRLHDRGERALPAHVLTAERQPPAVEPARGTQRRMRGAAGHEPRVEIAGVRGVERHVTEGTAGTHRVRAVRHPARMPPPPRITLKRAGQWST